MDICFVMSAEDTMHQRWMQYLATSIDNELMSKGIGLAEEARNLFCVVQFGAKGKEIRANVVAIEGKAFFRANEAPEFRRELKRNGFSADGYEAIEFTLNNVPFRNNSKIARSIILGTNTGRSTLSDKANLTKSFMLHRLKESNVTLDVVVNMTLQEEDHHASINQNHTLLGLVDYSHGVLLKSDGKEFPVLSNQIIITNSHGTTISDYVDLAFESGGSAWRIGFFHNDSFKSEEASAVAKVYVENRWYVQSRACQVCSWEDKDMEVCFQPQNQRLCKQCANDTTKNVSFSNCLFQFPFHFFLNYSVLSLILYFFPPSPCLPLLPFFTYASNPLLLSTLYHSFPPFFCYLSSSLVHTYLPLLLLYTVALVPVQTILLPLCSSALICLFHPSFLCTPSSVAYTSIKRVKVSSCISNKIALPYFCF